MKAMLIVAAGSGIGGVLRYTMQVFFSKVYPSAFPWGTFIVNIIGCFIIGLLFGLAERTHLLNAELRLLLITGFCGGFTTFSSFSIENIMLIRSGSWLNVILYIAGSIAAGLLATFIGMLLTRSVDV